LSQHRSAAPWRAAPAPRLTATVGTPRRALHPECQTAHTRRDLEHSGCLPCSPITSRLLLLRKQQKKQLRQRSREPRRSPLLIPPPAAVTQNPESATRSPQTRLHREDPRVALGPPKAKPPMSTPRNSRRLFLQSPTCRTCHALIPPFRARPPRKPLECILLRASSRESWTGRGFSGSAPNRCRATASSRCGPLRLFWRRCWS